MAGAAAILLEGLGSDRLGRFTPGYVLFHQPLHGGEVVGDAAGIAVLLLCAAFERSTLPLYYLHMLMRLQAG
ncbi:hypothetical protein [Corallococcus sicarius]|uniref:hypothetical protein n=1 Tax=Corallococcus sicarius TaxID=2316726 RepID=UPI0011C3F532|nr:hypothetical protein [Corallococcus sicarius]